MKKLYLILFLSLLIMNMQCGNGGERSIPVNTPVSINVIEAVDNRNLSNNIINGESENNVIGNMAVSAGPRQLSMCRFTITGPGMENIVREVDVTGKTSIKETFNVPSGLNRSFLIQMFVENSDMVLYQAQDDENLEGEPLELKMELKETSEYSKAPEFYGIKSVSNSATRSVMLKWAPAIDNITTQERIQYRVFLTTKSKRDKADENDIMTVYTLGNSTNRDEDPLITYEYAGDELILISYEYEGALPEDEQTSSDRLEPGVPYSFVVRARDEWGFEEENLEESGQIIVYWLYVEVEGSGTVTSAPEGINCREIGGKCSEDFLMGIPVALKAEADEGSKFEGWTGCNEADPCLVTPVADLPIITANFCDVTRYYSDIDGDGYGANNDFIDSCIEQPGLTTKGDCDDNNASINPSVTEECGNNIDENCDGVVEGCTVDCTDVDGDQYGFGADCLGLDCDDSNALINPGAAEVCDGVDNDCNAQTDETFTSLGNSCSVGIGACEATGTIICSSNGASTECNAIAGQASEEVCNDSIDNDCDGAVDIDDTNCQDCEPGNTQDCNTGLSGICSVGIETCGDNGIWDSCIQNNQPSTENCSDGLDNDCDGAVDNADTDCQECQPGATQSCSTGLNGICSAGTETCGNDGFWGACAQNSQPATENCSDGLDNDCDGSVDNADTDCQECQPGATQNCSTGLNGICSAGTETCGDDGFWGSCTQNNQPATENCSDGLDNDCDGAVDNADTDCQECQPGATQNCSTGLNGICSAGTETCGDNGFWGSCTQNNQPATENCSDGLDNDCDGAVDNADTDCQECQPGATQNCSTGLNGICSAGTETCGDDGFWGSCTQNNQPATENCSDGLDNDCDGAVDNADTDCQECQPGATQNCSTGLNGICSAGTETCGDNGFWGSCTQNNQPATENCSDGLDNDCDGAVDNADTDCQECQPGATQNCSTGLNGICSAGTETCGDDGFWGSCTQNNQPATENCSDGLDNDCDGSVDNADTDCQECQPGATQNCSTGLNGICSAGTETCGNDGFWGACAQNVQSTSEVCDGLDNDCDSSTDEGCDNDNDNYCDSNMTIVGTPPTCTAGGGDCADTNNAINPGAQEVCTNQVDDDCDGLVDYNDSADCVDTQPPSFNGLGSATLDCAASPDEIDLSWPAATDNVTPQNQIRYTVCWDSVPLTYSSTTADCIQVTGQTSYSINSIDGHSLIEDQLYYAGVTPRDNAGNWAYNEVVLQVTVNCVADCVDFDGDGYGVGESCLGPDCNDNNPSVHPGAQEGPVFSNPTCQDGLNNDCDTYTDIYDSGCSVEDVDGDGSPTHYCYLTGSAKICTIIDCNDNNSAMYPGATEVCDELDNDCNGLVDDSCNDITGVWDMTFDWECDNAVLGFSDWTINANGTWSDTSGYSGTWTLVGNQVTIFYPSSTYTGTVSGNYMSGTMVYNPDGTTGCWTATRGIIILSPQYSAPVTSNSVSMDPNGNEQL